MTEYIMKSSPILESDGTPLEVVGELIRCKDCRYDHECKHEMIRKSKGGGVIYCPVEFCSEGKKNDADD